MVPLEPERGGRVNPTLSRSTIGEIRDVPSRQSAHAMDVFAKARQFGIDTAFFDGQGQPHRMDPGALERLLAAMPAPAEHRLLNAPVVLRSGLPAQSELLPAATLPLRWQLRAANAVVAAGETHTHGVNWPVDLAIGVYGLQLSDAASVQEEWPLIVAPTTAYQGRFTRAWLLAVQLYSVRSSRNWGIGDFTDLKQLLELAASWGANGVGLNPLHALFAERPQDCSPYAPNSRLFLNPLYIDVEAVAEFPAAFLTEHRQALAAARQGDLIDYVAVAALKWQALRAAFDRFKAEPDTGRHAAFAAFCQVHGATLLRFACFEVLRCRFKRPWWQWPAPWQTPDDTQCKALRDGSDATEIEFVAFVQWVADQQMHGCRDRAVQLGLQVGLYLDVAVGVQPDGFDAWNEQGAIARQLAVGAPPDALNTAGQNWGLAGFNAVGLQARAFAPFRDMLRAAMRYAGAIRLDHILGLQRLYLVPHGFTARDGAYVQMPLQALLAVTAQESVAAQCVVIGEDLGTVPEGFREQIAAWGIWSYRVMMFERDYHGGFCDIDRYAENALVTFNTHDLASFAGWRGASDLDLKQSLGIDPGESSEARHHALHMLADVLRGQAIERDDFLGVLTFLARTPSRLLAVALDDLLAVVDQPNVPGTIHEHPNWRRRLPLALADFSTALDAAALADAVGSRRFNPTR
jgi:4-alpha-glucanotransferase